MLVHITYIMTVPLCPKEITIQKLIMMCYIDIVIRPHRIDLIVVILAQNGREAMTAHETLVSATKTNATILNRDGELGVVAPGALADLVVVNGDPLQDLGLLQDQGAYMPAIMKGGVFVKNELI